jgi:hypothetical protein
MRHGIWSMTALPARTLFPARPPARLRLGLASFVIVVSMGTGRENRSCGQDGRKRPKARTLFATRTCRFLRMPVARAEKSCFLRQLMS